MIRSVCPHLPASKMDIPEREMYLKHSDKYKPGNTKACGLGSEASGRSQLGDIPMRCKGMAWLRGIGEISELNTMFPSCSLTWPETLKRY